MAQRGLCTVLEEEEADQMTITESVKNDKTAK